MPGIALRAPCIAHDVNAATDGGRWVLRWRGWADWPLTGITVALAAAAVILDVATAWTGVALGALGRVPVSPALPLAALVVAKIGAARLGWGRRSAVAWRELAIGGGVVLVAATLAYAALLARPGEAGGLVLAALGEELVYRLAAVVVIGALTARLLGREWRNPMSWGSGPGFVALGGAALLFSALPGHVQQMTSVASSLPFASLALVLGYAVLRTGSVWPAALVHALLNLTTIATRHASADAGLRLAIAASALVALVAGADVAGRRLGLRARVPTVIDLRTVGR